MEKVVSATEAVRNFSDILNSVRYQGESYTIMRGGKPIASLSPVSPLKRKHLRELKEIAKSIPQLGDEADAFGESLKEIRKHQPFLPKDSKWA